MKTKKNSHQLLILHLCLLVLVFWAINSFSTSTASELPPYKTEKKSNREMITISKALSKWTRNKMNTSGVKVAVLARQGSALIKKFDSTGMSHAGFVMWIPEKNDWETFNLYSDPTTKKTTQNLWMISLEDFFYQQKSKELNALLLIPKPTDAEKIYNHLMNDNYKNLYFTKKFNLVSYPYSKESMNCTKWNTLNIFSALTQEQNIDELLKTMKKEFQTKKIKVGWTTKLYLWKKSDSDLSEQPTKKYTQTIRVESLYHSDLFKTKLFYDPDFVMR